MVMLARDVTERKKYDQAIKHLALYDALTNLPNRNLFNEQIKKPSTGLSATNIKQLLCF